ncbi:hypothetical protein [Kribbella sp. NPDC055071]
MSVKRAVGFAMVVAVGVSGCSSSGDDASSRPTQTVTVSASTSIAYPPPDGATPSEPTADQPPPWSAPTGPTPRPAPRPTPTPTPTQTIPYTALDGTNLKACNDAVCEVQVKVGNRLRLGAIRPVFRVASITKNAIKFTLDYPNGKRATLTLAPNEYAGFAAPMSFQITLNHLPTNHKTAIVEVGPLEP